MKVVPSSPGRSRAFAGASTPLWRELQQILSSIHRLRGVDLELPGSRGDSLLLWNWLVATLARSCPSLSMRLVWPSSEGCGRLQIAISGEAPEPGGRRPVLSLPTPVESDLLRVLLSWRSELMRHHGLLVPRSTLVRAFEFCAGRGDEVQGPLGRTLDLLDDAILQYRRMLLVVAADTHHAEQFEAALARLATAIETAARQHAGPPPWPRTGVRTAVWQLEDLVSAFGGPAGAATVGPEWICEFARLHSTIGIS